MESRLAAALDAVRKQPFTDPWQTWLEVMLTAWWLRVWPAWEAVYEVVLVEPRLVFYEGGVKFTVGPDLVLRSRADKSYWVYDFKSYRQWDTKKWLRAIQLQLGAVAVERELSKPGHTVEVAGTIIQGFYKGQQRSGNFYHPLVYGYRREEDPGVTKAAYSYEYKKGFSRFDVVAYPGGTRAWVEGAPESVIADCFPQTAPIYLNRVLMKEFMAQRVQRELDIHHAAQMVMDPKIAGLLKESMLRNEFEQNFGACESDRHQCPMFEVCHVEVVGKDPVGSGLYRLRGER
jgi:hypothetical protein